jgi:tetratricopeptide (TPR) repeat protein
MKHVLQSLLMTTVLTLPTAFATDQMPGFNESTTNALATAESNPKLSLTAQIQSMLINDPLDKILNTAFTTELWQKKISDDEHKALVTFIKGSITSNTRRFILEGILPNASPYARLWAAQSLKALGSKYHDRAAVLFEKSADYPTPGSGMVANILTAADALKQLGLADRALTLYKKAADYPTDTVQDTRSVTDNLKALGLTDRAAEVYERFANRDKIEYSNLQWAAHGLAGLGSKYHDRSAVLFELSANKLNVKPYQIIFAADGLRKVTLTQRAAAVYKKATDHLDATPI